MRLLPLFVGVCAAACAARTSAQVQVPVSGQAPQVVIGETTVPLGPARVIPITGPFRVTEEGLRFVPTAHPRALVLRWEQIDLARLARSQPAIETARQRALIDGTPTSFEVLPPPNPWREFLRTPVSAKFQWRLESRVVERSSSLVTPRTDGDGYLADTRRTEVTRLEETQHPDIDAPMEIVLMMISEESQTAVSRMRELRNHPDFFPNLLLRVRELEESVPEAVAELAGVRTALEKLYRDSAVSLAAQRRIRRFLESAQRLARAEA